MTAETLDTDLGEEISDQAQVRTRCQAVFDGRRCLLAYPHDDRPHASGTVTWGLDDQGPPEAEPDESYAEMFADYLAGQDWIGAADRPFVFHVRKICQQLDQAGADAKPALASTYLQALSRLDRRRPASTAPGGGAEPPDPAQRSIYDELD